MNTIFSLCVSINFIDTWPNSVAKIFVWRCCVYQENMKEQSNQIPTENPTPNLEYFKRKYQTLLTDIGGEWYLNNMHDPKPPTKKPRLSNNDKVVEDKLKDLLKVAYDHFKYCKFQIHWKLEYFVPLRCYTKKTPFDLVHPKTSTFYRRNIISVH